MLVLVALVLLSALINCSTRFNTRSFSAPSACAGSVVGGAFVGTVAVAGDGAFDGVVDGNGVGGMRARSASNAARSAATAARSAATRRFVDANSSISAFSVLLSAATIRNSAAAAAAACPPLPATSPDNRLPRGDDVADPGRDLLSVERRLLFAA